MSLEPQKFSLKVWKGATLRKTFTLHQGDINSPLQDLTGYTATCVLKNIDGTSLSNLTLANGGIIIGGTPGSPPISNTTGLPAPVQAPIASSTTGGTLPAGNYYYVVTATNNYGESLRSNETTITVTGTTSSNVISWAPVTAATGYRVYRGTSTGAEGSYYVVGAVSSYIDTGAAPTSGTPPLTNTTLMPPPVQTAPTTNTAGGSLFPATYYYVVTALNQYGETPRSNEQTITTTGSASINLINWNAVTGATSYRIYRGTVGGSENIYYTAGGSATSFADSGTGGTAGTITLYMSAAATQAAAWKNALYELYLTNPSGDTDLLLYGPIRIAGPGT